MTKKRLIRDNEQALIAGVIGGLAKYYSQDPLVFRILAITLILFTGFFPGVFIYIIMWLVVPKQKDVDYTIVE